MNDLLPRAKKLRNISLKGHKLPNTNVEYDDLLSHFDLGDEGPQVQTDPRARLRHALLASLVSLSLINIPGSNTPSLSQVIEFLVSPLVQQFRLDGVELELEDDPLDAMGAESERRDLPSIKSFHLVDLPWKIHTYMLQQIAFSNCQNLNLQVRPSFDCGRDEPLQKQLANHLTLRTTRELEAHILKEEALHIWIGAGDRPSVALIRDNRWKSFRKSGLLRSSTTHLPGFNVSVEMNHGADLLHLSNSLQQTVTDIHSAADPHHPPVIHLRARSNLGTGSHLTSIAAFSDVVEVLSVQGHEI